MTPEFENLVLRACGALGNGVLQGILVAVCVLVGLRFLRTSSAATRYVVAFAGLLTVATLPLAHFLAGPSGSKAPVPGKADTAATTPPEASFRVLLDPGIGLRGHKSETDRNHVFQGQSAPPDPNTSAQAFPAPEEATLLPDIHPFFESAVPLAPETATTEDRSKAGGFDSFFTRWPFEDVLRVSLPIPYALGALALWGVLAAIRLTLLAAQCRVLSRMKRSMEPAPDRVVTRFVDLRQKMGVHRTVRLGMISDLRSPIAVGFLHPAILLPLPVAAAPDEELDSLLRHELAHVRRRDDWTNLIQQAIKAVFFFHPGVLALSRRLTLDREIACDDHVLAAHGKARSYALFLTDFASRTHGRQFAAAPAALSNPTQLQERIHMILDPHRNTSPRVAPTRAGVLTLAALLIAITGIGAAPRVSLDATSADNDTTETAALASDADPTAHSDVHVDVDVTADPTDLSIESTPTLAVVTTITEDHSVDADDGGRDDTKPKTKSKVKTSAGSSSASSSFSLHSSQGHKPSSLSIYKIERDGPNEKSIIITAPDGKGIAAITAPHTPPVPPSPTANPAPAGPPRQIAHGPSEDRDLEERIRRLERLVERLANKTNPEKSDKWAGKPKDFELRVHPPKLDESHVFHFETLSREMEKVSKDVERGLRDAERAARQSIKTDELVREKASNPDMRKVAEARRRAVEGHREGLRKQIAALQSNIERLEGELDRLDDAVDIAEETEQATREALLESQRDIAESHAELAKELENAAREKERALRLLEKKGIEKKMELDRSNLFEPAKEQHKEKDKDKDPEKDKPKQKQKAPDEVPAPALPTTPSAAPSSGVRF